MPVTGEIATHYQNFYVACATATPALFIALAVQERGRRSATVKLVGEVRLPLVVTATAEFEVPVSVQYIGLTVMLVGEVACLAGLALANAGTLLQILAALGVVAGAFFVVGNITPPKTKVPHRPTAAGDLMAAVNLTTAAKLEAAGFLTRSRSRAGDDRCRSCTGVRSRD